MVKKIRNMMIWETKEKQVLHQIQENSKDQKKLQFANDYNKKNRNVEKIAYHKKLYYEMKNILLKNQYIENEINYRNNELLKITNFLQQQSAKVLYLIGRPGIGKTLSVKVVINKLGIWQKIIWINGLQYLHLKYVNQKDKIFVVDQFDQLNAQERNQFLNEKNLKKILICNVIMNDDKNHEMQLLTFSPYTTEQITAIITEKLVKIEQKIFSFQIILYAARFSYRTTPDFRQVCKIILKTYYYKIDSMIKDTIEQFKTIKYIDINIANCAEKNSISMQYLNSLNSTQISIINKIANTTIQNKMNYRQEYSMITLHDIFNQCIYTKCSYNDIVIWMKQWSQMHLIQLKQIASQSMQQNYTIRLKINLYDQNMNKNNPKLAAINIYLQEIQLLRTSMEQLNHKTIQEMQNQGYDNIREQIKQFKMKILVEQIIKALN